MGRVIAFCNALVEDVVDFQIHVFFQRQADVGHADLLALEDVGCTLQAVEVGCQHFGRLHPIFLVVAPAGNNAGQVVVIHEQAVPAFVRKTFLPCGHAGLQIRQIQGL